jgi:hypothetical protein
MDEFVRKYFAARRQGYMPSLAALRAVNNAAYLAFVLGR